MLELSDNLNYYLSNGNVDLRKGIFRETILKRIHHKVVMMIQNAKIMANQLMIGCELYHKPVEIPGKYPQG